MRAVLDQIGRSGPNTDLEESALKLLTESLVSIDRTPEAIATRQQFLARHEDDYTRGRNWSEIAKCYALLGQQSQEEQALRKALALEARDEAAGKEQSKAEQADLRDRLGLVLAHRGDLEGARQQWQEAAAGYQSLIGGRTQRRHDTEQRLGYLAKLQLVFEHSNQWQQAIRVGQQLLEYRTQSLLPDDPKLWRIKSTLGGLYARAGETEKARPLLLDALAYWHGRMPAAGSEIAQTLAQLSKVALADGDRQQAIAYCEEAVKACQPPPTGHELQLAEAYDNLGDVLAEDGRYDRALEQHEQAEKICRDRPNDRRAACCFAAHWSISPRSIRRSISSRGLPSIVPRPWKCADGRPARIRSR